MEEKKNHLITFYKDSFDSSENLVDFITQKAKVINQYIEKNIDSSVECFIILDFGDSLNIELSDYVSLHDPELILKLGNKIEYEKIEAVTIKLMLIFNPNESALQIWKDEFLELSGLLQLTITIYGYCGEFFDIIYQEYDCGMWEEGAIACDQGHLEDLDMTSYRLPDTPSDFPPENIFIKSF